MNDTLIKELFDILPIEWAPTQHNNYGFLHWKYPTGEYDRSYPQEQYIEYCELRLNNDLVSGTAISALISEINKLDATNGLTISYDGRNEEWGGNIQPINSDFVIAKGNTLAKLIVKLYLGTHSKK